MPRFIEGQARRQVTLLPESLDDSIVEELNLQALGFEGTQPAETGRAGRRTSTRPPRVRKSGPGPAMAW